MVVLVHEFGHFLAARRAGVPVYEFSIGFPFSPRIITLFRHRETEFTVRLLPLGGFVSFSTDGAEKAAELFGATSGRRALIMSAGSLSNIGFAFLLFIAVFAAGKHMPPVDAVIASSKTIWSITAGTFEFIAAAFSGQASWEGLTGPVGIAMLAGEAAAKGILNLLYFTGILSLSLGIMNLLPLPALDGGQLFILLVEIVRKKPLSLRFQRVINLVGIVLFLLLMVWVTVQDITALFV